MEHHMTSIQAFKFGFLLKCAEFGMTPDETNTLVKQALVGWLGGKAIEASPHLLGLLGTGMIAAPLIGGAGLGYAAGKLKQDDSATIQTTKNEELESEYNRLATEAEANARRRKLQAALGRRVSRMGGPRLAM
jgi:hypothetical protein